MIIDYIKLRDVGVFAGMHEISLGISNVNRPIVLFGGMNGAGKTTLLEAIQLCLLGPSAPFIQQSGREAYHAVLRRLINKQARYQFSSIEISFARFSGESKDIYRVRRKWSILDGNIHEELDVFHNQSLDQGMSRNWASHMEEFLPVNIARFFFFDGEKIEAYASPDLSEKMIADAINNLLGIDVIQKLQKDLSTVTKRRKLEKAPDVEKAAMQDLDESIQQIQQEIDALTLQRATIATRQLKPLEYEIQRIEAEYHKVGGDLSDSESAIAEKIACLTSKREAATRRLHDLAASGLPLAFVTEMLQRMQTMADKDNEIARAETAFAVLHECAGKLSRHMESGQIPPEQQDGILRFMAEHEGKFAALSREKKSLDMGEGFSHLLRQTLSVNIPGILEDATAALEEYQQVEYDLGIAEQEKASIPDSGIVDEIRQRKRECENSRVDLRRQMSEIDGKLEFARSALKKRSAESASQLAQIAQARLQEQDAVRFVTHAEKARDILKRFESAVAEHHIRRIERLVLESYRRLLHKSTLISNVKIDPHKFSVKIIGEDGTSMSASQLSAGERQLLAIALLWGLAKAAGKPLPVAIDTPMGRLDSEHRVNLVEGYFPNASHQVLLFSTDEEISGDYLQLLQKSIGRSYRLVYDDKTLSTSIQEGYF